MEDKQPTCEVCGRPATCGVRDHAVDHNPLDGPGWVNRAPLGPMHLFCDEHNRNSVEYDITTTGILQPPPSELYG